MQPELRARPLPLSALAVAVAAVLALGSAQMLLPVLPLLGLVASLLLGRYPGEEVLARLGRRTRPRRERDSAPPAFPAWAFPSPARHGLLLAASLSGRAPPA